MLAPRFLARTISVGLMVIAAGAAYCQDYPNKTIRIVVTGPGGGSDFVARLISQGIAGPLGQPVIVEYRGAGVLSAEFVSKAPPDGYTLYVAGSVTWVGPLLRKAPYDAVRDFAPVSLLVREVSLLAVHPSLPVKSVKELIALAKARPGELNYGSGVIGGTNHLAGELFKHMAGVNIAHVPYKGPALALTAQISGEVQLTFIDVGLVAPHVKSGRLRALAVTSPQPSALFPGLPPVADSGLPGYEATGMTGIWAPAKTPQATINRLNQEIVRVINLPDVKEKFLNAGVEPVGSSPEQFANIIKADIATTGKVIKDAGIKVD